MAVTRAVKRRAAELETADASSNYFRQMVPGVKMILIQHLVQLPTELQHLTNFLLAANFSAVENRAFWCSAEGEALYTRFHSNAVRIDGLPVGAISAVKFGKVSASGSASVPYETVTIYAVGSRSNWMLLLIGSSRESVYDRRSNAPEVHLEEREWFNIFCVVPGRDEYSWPIAQELLVALQYEYTSDDSANLWSPLLDDFNDMNHVFGTSGEDTVTAINSTLSAMLSDIRYQIRNHSDIPFSDDVEIYSLETGFMESISESSERKLMDFALEVITTQISSEPSLRDIWESLRLWDTRVNDLTANRDQIAAARTAKHLSKLSSKLSQLASDAEAAELEPETMEARKLQHTLQTRGTDLDEWGNSIWDEAGDLRGRVEDLIADPEYYKVNYKQIRDYMMKQMTLESESRT